MDVADKVEQIQAVEIPASLSVKDLAERLSISPVELMKALISNGIMASINDTVDYETAALVAEDLGFDLRLEGAAEREAAVAAELAEFEAAEAGEGGLEAAEVETGPPWYIADEDESALVERPPVVTFMGHVDHGKTSLLDALRKTDVTASESGGITQHIGAYTIPHGERSITFIDTPGHEAFTAMRARGAQATDIAVLVVAADDGVMPTTREAIAHARAARVPIVVAVNKVDLPDARAERVYEQLAELEVVADDWGGDTFFVRTSAESGEGLDDLLEALLLVADEHTPLANPTRLARGTVLEGKIDPSRGVIATLLVQTGTLKRGDNLVIGKDFARARAMFDYTGAAIDEAGPSTPVEVMGLSEVPEPGARFAVAKNAKAAKAMAAAHEAMERRPSGGAVAESEPLTLEALFARASAGDVKSLNLIVKTDVQGTLQPVVDTLEKLSGEVRVEILHADAGDIGESDINLAAASDAVVIGFRTNPDGPARRAAAAQRVEIREYDVIYKLAEDVQDILLGMLDPVFEDKRVGKAEVRAIFSVPRAGKIAGCAVLEGMIRRNAKARVLRGDEVLAESVVSSLKRFKDDVREVREGFECGIGVDDFNDFKVGDIIECLTRERVR